jgi:copper chaperone
MLTLQVPDISCGHCKATIEQAVGQVTQVKEVSVDVAAKSVRVQYDGATEATVAEAAIEAAVIDAGYTISTTAAG